ncbi:hypothetical protein VKS41_007433 [Umbelopsis sp. WA50703]
MLVNSLPSDPSVQSDLHNNENTVAQQLSLPMSQRRSLDPVLLNQLGTQIFHSHPSYHDIPKISHQSPIEPVDTGSSDFAIVQIDADRPLEYPKPVHIETKLHHTTDEKQFDNESIISAADVCPICLDSYQDGLSRTRTLPCSHYFHAECIDSWLLRENTTTNCPCCNFDVSSMPRQQITLPNGQTPHSPRRYFWLKLAERRSSG